MFVGHLAVALGARRAAPRAPLGALVAAAFALDLIWPVLLLAGIERVRIDPGNTAFTPLAFDSYPFSHSLMTTLVWGGLAGGAVSIALRSGTAGTAVGLAVVSHWVLDWVTHRPDLPIWPFGPVTGLGLWNSVAATLVVEGTLFAAGIAAYLTATQARDGVGRWAFWVLVVLATAIWVSGPFSPPPPGARWLARRSRCGSCHSGRPGSSGTARCGRELRRDGRAPTVARLLRAVFSPETGNGNALSERRFYRLAMMARSRPIS